MSKIIQNTVTIIFLSMTLFGCLISNQHDIYALIPKGTQLSKNELPRFEQFFKYKSDLIVIINLSTDADYYNPHLLFYDSTLTMYSACYFPAERIDSIKNNVIYADLNRSRESRKKLFRNDLPDKYELHFTQLPNGRGINFNKVIDKMCIESSSLRLHIRKTLNNDQIYMTDGNVNKEIRTRLSLKDTINLPLNDMNFFRRNNYITIPSIGFSNHPMWEKMAISNNDVWTKFYIALWRFLKDDKR